MPAHLHDVICGRRSHLGLEETVTHCYQCNHLVVLVLFKRHQALGEHLPHQNTLAISRIRALAVRIESQKPIVQSSVWNAECRQSSPKDQMSDLLLYLEKLKTSGGDHLTGNLAPDELVYWSSSTYLHQKKIIFCEKEWKRTNTSCLRTQWKWCNCICVQSSLEKFANATLKNSSNGAGPNKSWGPKFHEFRKGKRKGKTHCFSPNYDYCLSHLSTQLFLLKNEQNDRLRCSIAPPTNKPNTFMSWQI